MDRDALVEKMARAIADYDDCDGDDGFRACVVECCQCRKKARAALAVAEPELVAESEKARGYLIRNVLLPHHPNIEPLPDLLGVCTQVDNITTEITTLRAEVARLREALKIADQFITNGMELGFIRMPDPSTPDPALKTPEIIRAALETPHERA